VNARRLATYVGIAFVIFFVLSSPRDAGDVVHSGLDGIRSAADQLAAFVKSVVH
jgi:hypothetical protein